MEELLNKCNMISMHLPVCDDTVNIGNKILFSPHIGGITASSFRRGYEMIWEDIFMMEAKKASN